MSVRAYGDRQLWVSIDRESADDDGRARVAKSFVQPRDDILDDSQLVGE